MNSDFTVTVGRYNMDCRSTSPYVIQTGSTVVSCGHWAPVSITRGDPHWAACTTATH